ncbi:hypothetical protein LXL04_034659 [Taraxacum kok-saghyz]
MAPRFRGANNKNYQALIWHHKIFSPIKFLSGDLTTPVAGRPPGGFAIFPLPHPSYASSLRNFALISAWLCRRLRFHPSVTQVTIQEDLGGGGIVYSRYAKNGSSINIMNNWKNYPFNVDMVINEYLNRKDKDFDELGQIGKFRTKIVKNFFYWVHLCKLLWREQICIPESVLSHSQLYVTLSREISCKNTKVLVKPVKEFTNEGVYTSNVTKPLTENMWLMQHYADT